MAVLVAQHRAQVDLLHAVEQADAHDEAALAGLAGSDFHRPPRSVTAMSVVGVR